MCEVPGIEGRRPQFSWSVDGAPFLERLMQTRFAGDTVFPGFTRAGQTWTCRVELGGHEVQASTLVVESDPADLDPALDPVARWEEGVVTYAGGQGAQAVTLTWGLDGWSDRAAPRDALHTNYETMVPRAEVQVAMSRDENAAWVVDVEVPDVARALHMIFTVDGVVDDASGDEYAWDLSFPSVGPYLTWNDVATPANGIVVNWATGQPGLGVVEYGPDEENVAYAIGTEVGTVHHVALGGLRAGERWVYRVRDSLGRVSPWGEFRTVAPAEDRFQFLVAADMQDSGRFEERWPAVADAMAAAWPEARFILAPGDLPADDYPGLWWLFFDGGRELFRSVPLVPAVGNHDNPGVESSSDTTSWRKWFALPETPGSEAYWRLDYGRVRVLAINSEVAADLAEGGKQYGWMEAEMADLWDGDVRAADWTLAQFHVPAYTAGGRFACLADEQRPITTLFGGNIDAVIMAHEHIYQRFVPLADDGTPASSGEYGLGPDDGVLYLVTPAAGFFYLDTLMVDPEDQGGEQRGLLAWPELADDQVEVEGLHGFIVGDASPEALRFEFWTTGNTTEPLRAEVADSVTITR